MEFGGAFNCHKRRVFLDEVAPEDRSVQLACAARLPDPDGVRHVLQKQL